MSDGYFQKLSREQRKLIGQKGGQSQRSEAVQLAWSRQPVLIEQYKKGIYSIKELAATAEISERTMYRIILGK